MFKKGDKVMCISNISSFAIEILPLTIGKKYDILELRIVRDYDYYLILNDRGNDVYYLRSNFIKFEVYRNSVIDEILS